MKFFRAASGMTIFFVCTAVMNGQTERVRQDNLNVGIGFLYGRNNLHANYFFDVEDRSACGTIGNGSAQYSGLSLFANIPLAAQYGFHGELGYGKMQGVLDGNRFVSRTPINNELVSVERQNSVETFFTAFDVSALVAWRAPYEIIIGIGPAFSFPILNRFTQKESITSPVGLSYDETQSTSRTVASGELNSISPMVVSSRVSLSYSMPLTNNIVMIPELSYSYPLTRYSQAMNLDVHMLAFGVKVGATIPLTATSSSLIPFSQTATATRQQQYILDASLSLSGVDNDDHILPLVPMTVERHLIHDEQKIIPSVFFEEGAKEISSRYHCYTDFNEAKIFREDSLQSNDALRNHHEVLNIIGRRLSDNSSSNIIVRGVFVSGDDIKNKKIARERVEAVKKYLVNIWGIKNRRINVETHALSVPTNSSISLEEAARVDIGTDDPEILAPLLFSSVTMAANPPRLIIHPSITADTSIASYIITIATRSHDLVTFSGTTTTSLEETKPWHIDAEKISIVDDSLFVRLSVYDAVGQHVERVSSLPIYRSESTTTEHVAEKVHDKRIDRYTVVSFDCDASRVDAHQKRYLEEVAISISSFSSVRVIGSTDQSGESFRNVELSRARAEEVGRILTEYCWQQGVRLEKIIIDISKENNINDETLPESRFISRTATVEITTPIQ